MISGRLERYAVTVALALVLMCAASALLAAPAWAQTPDTTTLNVTKNVTSPEQATVGEDIEFTVTVTNTGTGAVIAEDVILTDPLPENTTFVSAEVIDGDSTDTNECDGPTEGDSSGTIRCELGDIDVGDPETVEIVVRPTPEAGEARVNNTATAKGENTASDDGSASVNVEPSNITIDKDDFPDPVDVGEELLYTIVVENEGGEGDPDAQDVTVVDNLPDTVELVDTEIIGGENDGDECDEQFGDDNTLECELGDIGPGEEVTVEILVEPQDEREITNIARVFVDDDDGARVLVDIDDESTEVTADDDNDGNDNDNDDNDNDNDDNDNDNDDSDNDDDDDSNGRNQYNDLDEDLDDFNEDLDRLDSDLDDLEDRLLDDDEEIVFVEEDDADGEVLDTSAVDKLPNTGGLSIIGAVAGLALLVTGAGVSLLRLGRGGRRGG